MSAASTTPTGDTAVSTDSGYRSPLLDLPGAVAASPPDAGVAAHYGDPLREQRRAQTDAVLVDRSHRGVVRVGGPDRLGWLHSLASQHLSELRPMWGTEALLLSPHGHVEHHLFVADDGEATWLDVEPGRAGALLAFLESMRFLLRVEPADVTDRTAVLALLGPRAAELLAGALGDEAAGGDVPAHWLAEPVSAAELAARGGTGAEGGRYPLARFGPGVLARRLPYGVDLLVERSELVSLAERLLAAGITPGGVDAFEAARIADGRARLGVDSDHRTIPHETSWLADAVHLDKGCYRGQETVARVHNLGRPPRRLVRLHLDGALAAPGSPVTAAGRQVGYVGTSRMHAELGPVALAMVRRSVPDDAALVVSDPDGHEVAAQIDPGSGPFRPQRPARPRPPRAGPGAPPPPPPPP
ncbi:MAG: folate-binding protein YgfZ, partial [Frankia sp.]|nr:folate-binding protein YgfZ [Frankia sp.]